VALMIEAAGLAPEDRVLEIGAGSGYAAAVMSRIARRVYAVERHVTLGEAARRRFEELGYDNIDLRIGDGSKGWPEAAPFDAILVAAGAPAPRRHSRNNSMSAAGLSFRSGWKNVGSGCSRSPVLALPRFRKRIWGPSCSCRWSASKDGPGTTLACKRTSRPRI